ncbi:MAG TPA: O-methyltransferase [Ferruginibacter sp.]|jgi:caffeoyl-CoA O-methyltransferase|nr:O-methyltransferase [Ferruginibacter sp.]
MEILLNILEQYAENFSSPGNELIHEVAEKTVQTHPHAHMLSGHLQGKFLEMISCLLQPKRILEIGTYTGFSALCLAKGVPENGQLHTIELRQADATTAQNNFDRSPAKEKIKLHVGDAHQIIPTLNETWDLVFIDADKTGYIDYYELILPLVKHNGLIIADNVLFHGEVLNENIKGKNAKAIHAFNEHIKKDDRVEQVLLTVRDGLLFIRKL